MTLFGVNIALLREGDLINNVAGSFQRGKHSAKVDQEYFGTEIGNNELLMKDNGCFHGCVDLLEATVSRFIIRMILFQSEKDFGSP